MCPVILPDVVPDVVCGGLYCDGLLAQGVLFLSVTELRVLRIELNSGNFAKNVSAVVKQLRQ